MRNVLLILLLISGCQTKPIISILSNHSFTVIIPKKMGKHILESGAIARSEKILDSVYTSGTITADSNNLYLYFHKMTKDTSFLNLTIPDDAPGAIGYYFDTTFVITHTQYIYKFYSPESKADIQHYGRYSEEDTEKFLNSLDK